MRFRAFLAGIPLFSLALAPACALFSMGNDMGKPYGEDAERVVTKQAADVGGASETAVFAAGCFWGIELAFQRVPGVTNTEVGYINGHKENPTYDEVCSGETGHAEALRVEFNPDIVTYDELLTVFWDRLNPTQVNGQGNDIGTQYRSGIYYLSDEQRVAAEASREAEQAKYVEPIATEIQQAETFWPAEKYHQGYLAKGGQCSAKGDLTPIRYEERLKMVRSGRSVAAKSEVCRALMLWMRLQQSTSRRSAASKRGGAGQSGRAARSQSKKEPLDLDARRMCMKRRRRNSLEGKRWV
eukprot:scaffold143_cov260-Pinguiococcus_pyrenoidosus.AAC.5